MKKFINKIVLVTGSTSGIGKATAIAFAKEGANVVVSGRRETIGYEVVNYIKNEGGEAIFCRCDVSNEDDVKFLVEYTVKTYGRLDYAVNNASISNSPFLLHECPTKEWDKVHNVNLKGTWLCMKYEIIEMLKNNYGSIVNVSSKLGLRATRHKICAYVSSKHAVIGLTRMGAFEYGKNGIRVNCICPGTTRTPLIDPLFKNKEEERKYIEAKIPIGKIAEPREVANAILFLSSDDASHITGIVMLVDGGMTLL